VRLEEGSIEVEGAADNEVQVFITKKARARTKEDAAGLLDQISILSSQEGPAVLIEVVRESGWQGAVHSDVEVRVPRNSDLKLVTGDGRIEIEDVEGRIESETGDGRIRLHHVTGKIIARTSDGSVVGEALSGDVDVRTGDGRVELAGSFEGLHAITSDGRIVVTCEDAIPLSRDWLLRTSNGSITMTLPPGLSANLEASTGDGRVENELVLDNAKTTPNRIKGTLGGGGKLILVKTSDGRVRLRAP
jgi:DUF4097 and DUF4098 domain-containing protein YvlB